MNTKNRPVITLSDLAMTRQTYGSEFDVSFAAIASLGGAKGLGARLVELSLIHI